MVKTHKMLPPERRILLQEQQRVLPQERHQLGPNKFLQDMSLQPSVPFFQAMIFQDNPLTSGVWNQTDRVCWTVRRPRTTHKRLSLPTTLGYLVTVLRLRSPPMMA